MTIELSNPRIVIKGDTEFVAICEYSELYDKKGVRVKFPGDDDFQVALFKISGQLYCVDNICPHRHADRIHEGIIKDITVMCPLHGWTYSLESGNNTNPRQGIKNLRSYKVEIFEGTVFIEKPHFEIPAWRK